MVMKPAKPPRPEFRIVAAGLFKATCLQLLDEVYENRNLSILVTKRGKLIGQLIGPPKDIKLSGPIVQTVPAPDIPVPKAEAEGTVEEHGRNKDKKKKKHK
jgi:hypothetical protein